MTSSLVGSEMCIRDRLMSKAVILGLGQQVPAQHEMSQHDIREDGHPVSYTHLTLPTICSV
eukprot:2149467-Prorocentrum_lima.AAC.1